MKDEQIALKMMIRETVKEINKTQKFDIFKVIFKSKKVIIVPIKENNPFDITRSNKYDSLETICKFLQSYLKSITSKEYLKLYKNGTEFDVVELCKEVIEKQDKTLSDTEKEIIGWNHEIIKHNLSLYGLDKEK